MMEKIKKYGIDAPLMTFSYLIIGLGVLVIANYIPAYMHKEVMYLWGVLLICAGLIALHTSLAGKSKIWDKIINGLDVKADAAVLDLGTGRGLVLTKLAKKLKSNGLAVGIDLWKSQDQLNNSSIKTQTNLEEANLECKVELDTGDIRDLPYANNKFDIVTTSFVVHNIKSADGRRKALAEAYRVLKDNGTFVLVDTGHHADEYMTVLENLGFKVTFEKCGFDGWWSGPWMGSYKLIATKA